MLVSQFVSIYIDSGSGIGGVADPASPVISSEA
jgi:hypothetical protein